MLLENSLGSGASSLSVACSDAVGVIENEARPGFC